MLTAIRFGRIILGTSARNSGVSLRFIILPLSLAAASCSKEPVESSLIAVHCMGTWRSSEESNRNDEPKVRVQDARFALVINQKSGAIEAIGASDETIICAPDQGCKAADVSPDRVWWSGSYKNDDMDYSIQSSWYSELDRVTGSLAIKQTTQAESPEFNGVDTMVGEFECAKSDASDPLPTRF